jgi:hypothetical protein
MVLSTDPKLLYNSLSSLNRNPMTADLAASLLNRAANGAELLSVLDSITDQVEQENIADAAAHYAAISAPTAEAIQF